MPDPYTFIYVAEAATWQVACPTAQPYHPNGRVDGRVYPTDKPPAMFYYAGIVEKRERAEKTDSPNTHRRIEMTKYIARNIRFVLSQLAAVGFGLGMN